MKNIEILKVDLINLEDVKSEIQKYNKINVLINNAGIWKFTIK